MNKEEAKNFRERWQIVEDRLIEERMQTSAAVKLQQLSVIFEATRALGWADALLEGEEEVRERWRTLKERWVA